MNRKPSSMLIFNFNKWNQPWFYFFIFFISNCLIAYGFLGLEEKLFIIFYGILLPFVFCLFFQFRNSTSQINSTIKHLFANGDEVFINPTVFPIIAIILLLLTTRFYRLDSIPFWPSKDDGHFGVLGMWLSEKWSWQLLWGECQNEPLILWMLAFYFKWIEPSFFSLRLFSALVSICSVPLGYWAARQFFSKGYSLILTFFLAFNFWALISSRICIGVTMVIPLEYAVFGALGRWLKNLKISNHFQYRDVLVLGILSGLGFYTYAVWPVIFLSISIVVFYQMWKRPQNKIPLLLYGSTAILVSCPILLAHLALNGTTHLRDEFLRQSITGSIENYFQMLFWKGGYCFNGPIWGGAFNPVEGALIFLGTASLMMDFKKRYSQWFFLTGFLFILPGVLSNSVEICHVIQLLPFLCFIAVLGIQTIIASSPSTHHWKRITIMLLAILILNLYHWLGPFQDWKSLPSQQSDWVPIEYFQAYKIIKEKSLQSGPLNVFSEFTLDNYNKTLSIACHPLDALQNSRIDPNTTKWSAVLINKYYVPFLKTRFSHSQWFLLKRDDIRYHSDLALGLIPNDSIKKEELAALKKADHVLRDLNLQLKAKTSPVPWTEIKSLFYESSKSFENDRFLSAVFWEKIAFFDSERLDYGDATQDFERSIRFGYPAANLYYNLEMTLKMSRKEKEAKKILQKAVQAQQKFIFFEPTF